MTTVQAQRVIDALKALGLKHGGFRSDGDFTVRTERTWHTDRYGGGRRYVTYGDAFASIGRKAQPIVEANADALAAQGLQVLLLYGNDAERDTLISVVVSSKYNRVHHVSVLRDGEWSYRTVASVDA